MANFKFAFKALLGTRVVGIINYIRNYFLLRNVYNSKFEKRVLISYIKEPFRRSSLQHTNFYEAITAAKIFDSLGYSVDVMHYAGRVPSLRDYDVIYGFGDVFTHYYERGGGAAKAIYYGAGMHVCHQNNATLSRVKDVYRKKGVWLCGSARYVEKSWTHQTALVDGIIALGNERCASTYKKHFDGPVLACPAPFFQTIDYRTIISKRSLSSRKGYLWFGSAGLIHKGLDLCLEYFQKHPDLNLHVCGNILSEPGFVSAYRDVLFSCPNIHVHGFVNVSSNKFREIMLSCSFVVFPSCSEGGAPSVLTVVGNGALIPVVSLDASIDAPYGFIMRDLTADGFADAISKTRDLSDEEIVALQTMSAQFVLKENSQSNYEQVLRSHILALLGN